ncbi:MAG: hypothetical protein QHJ34_16195, partial [bacterium]|nr:hypothetical protein [bacterium]
YPFAGQRTLRWLLLTRHQRRLSATTINRILHDYHLIVPRQKRWRHKVDLSTLRKTFRAFHRMQIDVKYLNDIATLWPLIYLGKLPK